MPIVHPKVLKADLKRRTKSIVGLRYYHSIRQSWQFTEHEYELYQRDQFLKVYDYARRRIPYYRDRPEVYSLVPETTRLDDILRYLPVLGKQEVRENTEFLWPDPPPRFTTIHHTSGTSGTPLRISGDIWERGFYHAVQDQWFKEIIGERWPRTLHLTGFITPEKTSSDIYWIDKLTGNAYLSIYSMRLSNRGTVRQFLASFKPELIFGYASAINELAHLIGTDAKRNDRVVVTTSETLEPSWREQMEENLCRKVYDFYSSQECSHMAMECDEGHLHINPLIGKVEIVDQDGLPTCEGGTGRVIVTGLYRRGMPLFRYEIGDSATSTGFRTNCPCGLTWPTMGAIAGRTEDLVRTRDGRNIPLLCFHATKDLDGIREAQLIQRGFERFEFRLALADRYCQLQKIEQHITAELSSRLSTNVSVDFSYLESIPRGANGKFKAVTVQFDEPESMEIVTGL